MKSDNELIAEFMSKKVRYAGTVLYLTDEDGYIDYVDGPGVYWPDRDWQQLMPVVEKIENLGISTKIECDGISTQVTIRQICVWENPSSKIEKVYKAVVEFIKWHNSQQK